MGLKYYKLSLDTSHVCKEAKNNCTFDTATPHLPPPSCFITADNFGQNKQWTRAKTHIFFHMSGQLYIITNYMLFMWISNSTLPFDYWGMD